MLSKLEKTRHMVKRILEDDERARDSDTQLYLQVIREDAKRLHIDLNRQTVETFFAYPQGFTPFETVRRARQYIQGVYPELAGSRKIRKKRAELEQDYREFAKGGETDGHD